MQQFIKIAIFSLFLIFSLSAYPAVIRTGGGGSSSSSSGTVNNGTANQVARYATTGTTISGSSLIYDDLTNVGIGTVVPQDKLDIAASDTGTTLTNAGLAMAAIINTNTTANNFSDLAFCGANSVGVNVCDSKITGIHSSHTSAAESGTIAFLTDNAGSVGERMRIKNDGNIGIGTTTPQTNFVVMGNVGIGTWTSGHALDIISSATTSISSSGSIGITGNGRGFNSLIDGRAGFTPLTTGSNGVIGVVNDLIIQPNSAETARFSVGGNLGIGTSTPGYGVTVLGNVGIGTWVNASGFVFNVAQGGSSLANITTAGQLSAVNFDTGGVLKGHNGNAQLGPDAGVGIMTFTNGASGQFDRIGLGTLSASNPALGAGGKSLSVLCNDGTFTCNLGIGTRSASAQLEIVKSGTSPYMMLSSTTTGAGDKLIITSTGNVGISTFGTVSAPLVVGGAVFANAGTAGPTFAMADNTAVGIGECASGRLCGWNSSGQVFQVNAATFFLNSGFNFQLLGGTFTTTSLSDSAPTGIAFQSVGGATRSSMYDGPDNAFLTTGIGGTNANPSIILQPGGTGNIGINTISPASKLTVNGGAAFGVNSASAYLTTSAPVGGMIVQGNVGLGSLTPGSASDVAGKSRVTAGGHIITTGTAPTVANNDCGSTSQGAIVAKSTDNSGTVTVGTLTVTSCAVTFATAWTVAPNCVVVDDTSILTVRPGTISTTKLTLNSTTSMSGDNVTWICQGNE